MSLIVLLNDMQQGFDASPHQDLYRSTALGELFCSDNLPSLWDFCNIYLNSSVETRSWFKSCLEDFRYQNLFVDLETILLGMQEQNILNHENIHALESYENDEPLILGLSALQMEGILNQENLDFICSSTKPYHLSNALISLNQAGILNPDNRELVATHLDPVGLASALNVLHDAEILTPENRDILVNTLSFDDLIGLLNILQIEMLLNQENFELILGHRDIKALQYVLDALCEANILNQANFDILMQADFAPLLTEHAVQHVWSRIPRHLLNQANFNRFLINAEGDDIVNELMVVLNQNLVNAPAAPRARPIENFNDAQSTHTASVHRTVSKSAYNLETSYGENLNL